MVAAEGGDLSKLFGSVHRARGIVRVAEQHHARARGLGLFPDLPRRQVKAVVAAARDRDQIEAGHGRERAIVRVEGLDQQHVVALVRASHHREQHRFAAAGGGDQLVRGERKAETPVVLHEAGQALRGAGGGRVGVDARRFREPAAHGLGSVEVRLADVEVKYLHPALFRRVGQRHELANGRCRHPPAAIRHREGHSASTPTSSRDGSRPSRRGRWSPPRPGSRRRGPPATRPSLRPGAPSAAGPRRG